MQKSREEIEVLAKAIVDALVNVHRELGPGLLESTYQACLAYELRTREIEARWEVLLPTKYGGVEIEAGYRIDMLVAESITIENKSVQAILPLHEAQLLTLSETVRQAARLSRQLERAAHQGWNQTDRPPIMNPPASLANFPP
ncbi:MAG TPA: GxxExxY protein [Pirellulales bacterium]|jgi:GxxExxY protein|nr:GxxExxY protein [Pirellulales bacterium]